MGNVIDFSGRPIHFIGIGGIGMSGLAYVLARRGLPVSGSDLRSTNITQKLSPKAHTSFSPRLPAI
jgi:UDP-N-acetylmuramate--alanine ligase